VRLGAPVWGTGAACAAVGKGNGGGQDGRQESGELNLVHIGRVMILVGPLGQYGGGLFYLDFGSPTGTRGGHSKPASTYRCLMTDN
jgi:hypothetical protein